MSSHHFLNKVSWCRRLINFMYSLVFLGFFIARISQFLIYILFLSIIFLFFQEINLNKVLMNNKLAFTYPPNKQDSLRHRKANRIFRKIDLKQKNQQRCTCCGKYIGEDSEVDCICYDPYFQLEFLGAGVPLLFSFMKNMAILLMVFIVIVIIYGLSSNLVNNSCKDCQKDWAAVLSISSKIMDVDSISVQIYLIVLMTGIWIFLNQYIVYRLRKTQFQTDYYIQTPSDFAILITELSDQTTEKDIKDMVERRRKELSQDEIKATNNLKIKNILLPKKLDDYHEEQLRQQQSFMQAIKNNQHKFYKRIQIKVSQQIARVALVIFQQQASKQFFLQKGSVSSQIKSLFCSWGIKMSEHTIKNENVAINRAPEPDDIIWNNLGKSSRTIFLYKVGTYVLGAVLLFINGVIQYFLAVWAQHQPQDKQQSLSLLSSIIMAVVNYLITVALVWATKKEGNLTSTIQSQSLCVKIVYFQFINSGLFYVFSNALAVNFDLKILQQIFSQKVTTFMLINAFSQPFITFIVDFFQLQTALPRLLYEKQFAYFTQKQCNQIYELPDCQIPFKYAYIVRTLWLTFFFSPFVPIVAFISLIGIIFYYYVCKVLFRYSYRLPHARSNEINTVSLWLSYSLPLALNLGQLLIYIFIGYIQNVNVNYSIHISVYISLAMSILWMLVPWYEINAKLFEFKQKTNQNYDQNAYKFQITYQMIDPFYNGQRTSLRDSNFIRKQLKRVQSLPDAKYSLPVSKNEIECLPYFATDPQLPFSDRNLQSTQ